MKRMLISLMLLISWTVFATGCGRSVTPEPPPSRTIEQMSKESVIVKTEGGAPAPAPTKR